MSSSSSSAEVNLLKAKLEAQKKDKTIYLMVGLFIGFVVGFFVTDHLNKTSAPAAAGATGGVTQLPGGGGGDLPADHPPVEGAQGGGGMQPVVRETLQKAKDNPNDFEAQMKAAGMYYQVQMYDKALEYVQRAYKLKPDDYDMLVTLANVTYDAQKFSDAVPLYERALRLKPEDVEVRSGLGSAYHQTGQQDKAVAEYRKALGTQPKDEKALFGLAHVLLEKGDARGAEDAINRLAESSPQNEGLAKLRTDLNELKTKGKIPTH